jgi:phage gp36-like protein
MDLRREARARVDAELVETILGDTAVELDSALRNYYEVPITRAQPIGWSVARLIHKYWALAEVYNLLAPASGNTDGYFAAAEVYREKGAQLLDDIAQGSTRLPDVPKAGEAPEYPESKGATIALDLIDEVDDRNVPIFSVNSIRRAWRLE